MSTPFRFTGAVNLNGATSITGSNTLNVGTGLTTLGGGATITGAVSINGATSITGTNTFSVGTGATSLGGGLTVTAGGASITGAVNLVGNTSVTGSNTLTVGTGLTTLGGGETVTGAVNLNGATSITGSNTLNVGTGLTTLGGGATITGNLTLAAGNSLVNNSGTIDVADTALTNYAANASLGTAAATVNIYTTFNIPETSTGVTITLPTPTTTPAAGNVIYVNNTSTGSFTMAGVVVGANSSQAFIYNGSAWEPLSEGAGGSYVNLQTGTLSAQVGGLD